MGEFHTVMETAFQSMQDPLCGTIQSVEIVPWVSNGAFQYTSGINTPFSRSVIICRYDEGANGEIITVNENNREIDCVDNDTTGWNDTTLMCGWTSTEEEMYNKTNCAITGESEDLIPKEIRKFNILANAEFIASLDAMVRQAQIGLNLHINCLGKLLDFHSDYMDKALVNHKKQTALEETLPTVVQMRSWLLYGTTYVNNLSNTSSLNSLPADPASLVTGGLLPTRKQKAINDKIKYFVKPCVLELTGEKFLIEQGMMQIRHWTDIDECNKVKCTFSTMEMNEQNTDCTHIEPDFVINHQVLENHCPPELFIVQNKEVSSALDISVPFVPPKPHDVGITDAPIPAPNMTHWDYS